MVNFHFKKLAKSKFVRNLLIVATGTAGAQAVTLISTPIVTRLYSPDALGLLGVFMAFIAILAPITALSYPIAIILPKKDHEAKGLVKLSLCIATSMAIMLTVLLIAWGQQVLSYIGSKTIIDYAIYIPFATLFVAVLQITKQWMIRKKQFKITAKVAVYQALIVNFSKIIFGFFNPIGLILIIIAVVGSFIHSVLLWLGIRKSNINKKIFEKQLTNHDLLSLKNIAIKHQDFPLYRAPQVFISALSQSIPVFMLASFFGPAAAGFYSLARTILELPASLIGQSVGDVFNVRINEAAHKKENLSNLIIKATLILSIMGAIPFITVIMFGPWLFEFVLGEGWRKAGEYASWLSYILFFQLINRPAVLVIPILGLQKELLIHEILSTFGKLLAIYIGIVIYENDIVAVVLFSIFGSLAYITLIVWIVVKSWKYCDEKCE